MMRIMFCFSLAIFAILPTLFAIMDDELYVYVDDNADLSTSTHASTSTNAVMTQQIDTSTTASTQSPDCNCGK